MMKTIQFPLVKITLFFLFGLLLAGVLTNNLNIIFSLLGSMLFVCIVIYFKKIKFTLPIFEICTYLISFLIGISTVLIHDQSRNKNHYLQTIKADEKTSYLNVTITEKLKKSDTKNRYEANVNSLDSESKTGKIILNIAAEQTLDAIAIGTILNIKGALYKNQQAKNPSQFDYSSYLEKKQIYAQVFTSIEDCKIERRTALSLNYYAGLLRGRIINNLKKNNFNDTELNVVIALFLGQQQEISPEILKEYQLAGAIHVLSVSGLHVGFILLFITFLLSPIPNTKKGLHIKLIITLLSLWMFGILAGLAPCVVRSVTMFSFLAIGNFMRRSVNINHTLLVSMLLILLIEPSFLYDVGFQLSYSALFFILWLQPLLSAVYRPKSKVVSYFWDIVTVSFAAQIGTFPLSIYYFHQFPGLFFVTNLIILPSLTFILAIGIVVILMASANLIWVPLMNLLEYLIWFLNQIIKKIASFEDFVFKDISLSFAMMLGLYLILFCWINFSKKPSVLKLYAGLLSIICFQIICLQTKVSIQKSSEFIVLSTKKSTLFVERSGKITKIYATDSILKILNKNTTINSLLIGNFTDSISKKPISNLYYFKNKKILVLDSASVVNNEKPNILILSHSPKINLERYFLNHKPEIVVVDNSNFKSYKKIWKKNCEQQKIPFHDVSEKGFYKL